MKSYVKDIQEKIGEEISETFVLEDIKSSRNENAVIWNTVILSDKTGSISGVIWQTEMQEIYYSYIGKYVTVQAKVTLYNGKKQLNIASMQPADKNAVNVEDFIYQMDKSALDNASERLFSLIGLVTDNTLYKVMLLSIFKPKMIACMASKPAALKYYHAFNGGLLIHTVETAEIAVNMVKTDNGMSSAKEYHRAANMDLVIAGALLHDIGKVYTLTAFPFAEKNRKGMLSGHVIESIKFVNKVYSKICSVNRIDDEYEMKMEELEHVIRAAHTYETSPKFKEAIIIRNANQTSSMMDACDTALASSEEDKDIFSSYLNTTLVR